MPHRVGAANVTLMTDRRPPLDPATARVRRAVRETLASAGVGSGGTVLVALSGGADSLALAAATAFESIRGGFSAGAVIVDHGLQEGSAETAGSAAQTARALGLDPVTVVRVTVEDTGGPEAAARNARHAALDAERVRLGADAVLYGHTLDDQAETVLLGLARGAGATSLRGMAAIDGTRVRPLLELRRADTEAACAAEGLTPWSDPHNREERFARVRVRHTVLPVLERELGPGIAEALARTAAQLAEDADALDAMVEETIEEICAHAEAGIAISASALAANPPALRHRVIRLVARSEFGVSLSRAHTLDIARLATAWHGQGPLHLPGMIVRRDAGLIYLQSATELDPNAEGWQELVPGD